MSQRSAVDILIVEDRRRQLVVNNDVEQVADETVDAYLAPCRFEAETRDQVMFDLDFCWCASWGLSGSRAALHLGQYLSSSVDLMSGL
jgi:hypothetical protein